MTALNNLRKKRNFLTLGEDELLAEMVRSYPCFYDLAFVNYRNLLERSCKPLAFTSYKVFLKNKKRPGNSCCKHFGGIVEFIPQV